VGRRKLIAALLVLCAGVSALIAVAASSASAFTWYSKICTGFAACDSSGHGNDGYESVYTAAHWRMFGGHNCTNYAAYRMIAAGAPSSLPYLLGDAAAWGTVAAQHGVRVDHTPVPGSIAWFTASAIPSSGHVAYVESVNAAAGTITVSEDNFGGDFDWRQYQISDVSGFIHFHDPAKPAGSPITVTPDKAGRLELFGTDAAGNVQHRWQTTPGGAWSAWSHFTGPLVSVAAGTDADGRIELFGVNAAGQVYHRWQTSPDGAWANWVQFGGSLTSITVASNKDGRLELFGTNAAGNVAYRWQTTPGGAWSAWAQFGGPLTRVAAATDAGGKIELFGVNAAGNVYHRWQATPGGAWSAWTQFGGSLTSITVASNKDGRLELFGTNAAGNVAYRWQTSPDGAWSAWAQFGGPLTQVAAATNADGRIELFGVNPSGSVYHRWQTTPGGAWSGWSLFGGTLRA
jgi:surface antigen